MIGFSFDFTSWTWWDRAFQGEFQKGVDNMLRSE